jgi:hypothetical protein
MARGLRIGEAAGDSPKDPGRRRYRSPLNSTLMIQRLSFYFYVFYCLEVGIFLVIVPWWLPQVWEQNYIYFIFPALKRMFLSGYFRGAVSGLGIVNILLGILEVIQHERVKRIRQI